MGSSTASAGVRECGVIQHGAKDFVLHQGSAGFHCLVISVGDNSSRSQGSACGKQLPLVLAGGPISVRACT